MDLYPDMEQLLQQVEETAKELAAAEKVAFVEDEVMVGLVHLAAARQRLQEMMIQTAERLVGSTVTIVANDTGTTDLSVMKVSEGGQAHLFDERSGRDLWMSLDALAAYGQHSGELGKHLRGW